MKTKLLALFILSVVLISCQKKKEPISKLSLGLDYYPKTIGKYVIYNVDSTIFNSLSQTTVSIKYQIKEKISEVFKDNENKDAFRLERFIKKFNPLKPYDSIPWTIKEVWMVNATDKSIEVVEGNVRYTKLIFPIKQYSEWNGNAKNSIGEWIYSYDYINKTEIIGSTELNNVLMVKQKSLKTLISNQNYIEKYAKDIGLVYREITDVTSNNILPNIPIEDRIEDGVIYKQTFISYGYE